LHAGGNGWTVQTIHTKTPPRKLYSSEAAQTSPAIEAIAPLKPRQAEFL